MWGYKVIHAFLQCEKFVDVVPIFLYGPNLSNDRYPFWLDNVWCRVTESKLIDCPANPIGINDCGHNKYARVSCTEGINYTEKSVLILYSRYNRRL